MRTATAHELLRRAGGVTGIILVTLCGTPVMTVAPRPSDVDRRNEPALDTFAERIEAHVALRRRAEAPLPPLQPTTDMRAVHARKAQLASAIKAARPDARQGDIFTPTVAVYLRRVMLAGLEGVDIEGLLLGLYDEHDLPRSVRPHVHDIFPEWATHAMPPILLLRLPPLPEDIEYRLIGYDLILLDVRAGLIIDVLPGAIPRVGPSTSSVANAMRPSAPAV